MYAKFFMLRASDAAAIYAVQSVLVLVGLWLQSRMARYVGAAYYLFVAGATVYGLTLLSKPIVNVGIVSIVTTAVLGLVAASILVLSKPFAREFAAEREKRPAYKKILLNAYTALIALAAAAATLADIVHLFSR
ncbi:MAG: hypothetical protein ABJA75_02600 [Bradyrhizobium sp.]